MGDLHRVKGILKKKACHSLTHFAMPRYTISTTLYWSHFQHLEFLQIDNSLMKATFEGHILK